MASPSLLGKGEVGMKKSGAIRGVIKHRQTEQYYAGDGGWTEDKEEAKVFKSLSALVDEALKYNIRDCCEFILAYDENPGFDVYLPL